MASMSSNHSAMVLMKTMPAPYVGDHGDMSVAYYHANQLGSYQDLHIRRMHGPRRVITFCLLIAVLPTVLLVIPLYLRHSVYADVAYEVTESEVLKIVEGISSIFCQEHSLKMNSTFTAYQLGSEPTLSPIKKHIHMKKSMLLPDDTLEYWGFYLLSGSSMRLSACSRYEGGRVMVVRGDRNLRTCGLLDHKTKGKGVQQGAGGKEGTGGNKVRITFENKPGTSHKGVEPSPVTTKSPVTQRNLEVDIAGEEEIDIDGGEVSGGDAEAVLGGKDETEEKTVEEEDELSEEEDDDDYGSGSGDYDDDEIVKKLIAALKRKGGKKKLKELGLLEDFKSKETEDEDDEKRKRHSKRGTDGVRRRSRKVEKPNRLERLKRELGQEKWREKREEAELVDGGVKHGGTAVNYTKQESKEDSESSFEMGLKDCYGGGIEFQEEFSPSDSCSKDIGSKDVGSEEISQPTIRVEHEIRSNGYYYYIFYSDNDRVTNEVHAIFDIHKTVYEKGTNKSENSGVACVNTTECTFPIGFFSGAIVIVEIPTRDGIDRDVMDEVDGPQGAILISSCHPRMSVYIIFPVAVLFLILGCAFL